MEREAEAEAEAEEGGGAAAKAKQKPLAKKWKSKENPLATLSLATQLHENPLELLPGVLWMSIQSALNEFISLCKRNFFFFSSYALFAVQGEGEGESVCVCVCVEVLRVVLQLWLQHHQHSFTHSRTFPLSISLIANKNLI